MAIKEPSRLEISIPTVKKLIFEQFPEWKNLEIVPVERSGWDNRTFHLGDDMSVRMPSAERYIHQVQKEQQWLPWLGTQLSVPISTPMALGRPSEHYPWNWSIYKWIEGSNADTLNPHHMEVFAKDIANFLLELHSLNSNNGPQPGPFFRGASVRHYDEQTRMAILALDGIIDTEGAYSVWKKAVSSQWESEPLWVHGDFSPGNILVKNDRLTAVIDFGNCCVGDPACDLVIAWTFLGNSSRDIFKKHIHMDTNTWARARGWGIWKALVTLADLKSEENEVTKKQKQIIDLIINEHRYEELGK